MLAQLFSIVAPVLITVGLGYGWVRSGRSFDVELVTTLITLVGAPCLVFHTLANLHVPMPALLSMLQGAGIVMAVCAAVGAAVLRALQMSQRAFLPTLTFGNTGNLGLPVSFLAFGQPGLDLAVALFALSAVGQFTLGVAIASGRWAPAALARVPLLWALPPALAFLLAGETPPKWLNDTTKLIGDMTIPLMLITLGVSLGTLKAGGLRRSAGLAVLRLAMGFAAGLLAATLLGLQGAERAVLILQAAMPVAVFNYLFAQRYGTEPQAVAGAVVVSTVLSFATLPLLLWFVL